MQAYAPPAQDEKAITLPDTLYRLSIPQQAETGRGLEPVLLAHRMAANELPALAREDAHAQRTFAKNPDHPSNVGSGQVSNGGGGPFGRSPSSSSARFFSPQVAYFFLSLTTCDRCFSQASKEF